MPFARAITRGMDDSGTAPTSTTTHESHIFARGGRFPGRDWSIDRSIGRSVGRSVASGVRERDLWISG